MEIHRNRCLELKGDDNLRTIADIEGINLRECFFSKNEYNQKFVSLKIEGKTFQHRFFRSDKKGDYINYKRKKYYYPYNGNKFLI